MRGDPAATAPFELESVWNCLRTVVCLALIPSVLGMQRVARAAVTQSFAKVRSKRRRFSQRSRSSPRGAPRAEPKSSRPSESCRMTCRGSGKRSFFAAQHTLSFVLQVGERAAISCGRTPDTTAVTASSRMRPAAACGSDGARSATAAARALAALPPRRGPVRTASLRW